MEFKTLIIKELEREFIITFNRPLDQNSINSQFLYEFSQALDLAEQKNCIIILEGQQGVFSTGMDFKEISVAESDKIPGNAKAFAKIYIGILKRMATMPRVIIAKIDGKVLAGGVGFAAASDLVVATEKTTFTLSEALWGLLPANVLPYLIRRIGFQKAYTMTLTTGTITAKEALDIHLVDELSQDLDKSIRKLSLRLRCLDQDTIRNMKAYFRKMWIITEEMEQLAIEELAMLLSQEKVQKNIKEFIQHGKFPWC